MQFDESELDGLVCGEGFPKCLTSAGMIDGLVDAELGGAAAAGGLTKAIFVDKSLGEGQARVERTKDG